MAKLKHIFSWQVAIEQLQQELTTSRKEEQAIREEAQRVSSNCPALANFMYRGLAHQHQPSNLLMLPWGICGYRCRKGICTSCVPCAVALTPTLRPCVISSKIIQASDAASRFIGTMYGTSPYMGHLIPAAAGAVISTVYQYSLPGTG